MATSPTRRTKGATSRIAIYILGALLLLCLGLELYVSNGWTTYMHNIRSKVTDEDVKKNIKRVIQSFFTQYKRVVTETPVAPYNGADLKNVVQVLPEPRRTRIVVTGGGGFIGSHLVDRLMSSGHQVTVLDNFYTGRRSNLQRWVGHPNFRLITHDIVEPILLEVDEVYHLACPSAPMHYQQNPIKTIKTNTRGTMNMLGLAKRCSAKFLFVSAGDVYGDAEVQPQTEQYWGSVDPLGPRSSYEEGKRVAETMVYAFEQQSGLEARVARVFNAMGPRMPPDNGRVITSFISKAVRNEDLIIYGDGSIMRSFQYVDDLVDGLIALMASNYSQPVNLGHPEASSIKQLAEMVIKLTASNSTIRYEPETNSKGQFYHTHARRPDITVAKRVLRWQPKTSLESAIKKTIAAYIQEMNN